MSLSAVIGEFSDKLFRGGELNLASTAQLISSMKTPEGCGDLLHSQQLIQQYLYNNISTAYSEWLQPLDGWSSDSEVPPLLDSSSSTVNLIDGTGTDIYENFKLKEIDHPQYNGSESDLSESRCNEIKNLLSEVDEMEDTNSQEAEICTATPTDEDDSDSCDEILQQSTIDYLDTTFPNRRIELFPEMRLKEATESSGQSTSLVGGDDSQHQYIDSHTSTPTGEDSTSDSCDEILRNSTIDFKLGTTFPSRCFDAQSVVQTSPTTESNKSQHDSEGLPDLNTCTLTLTGEDSTSDSCDEILRNAAIDVELGVIFSNSCIETTASGESELKICTLTPTCDDSASDSCDEILRNSTIDFKLGTAFPSRYFDTQSVVQTSTITESNKSQHDDPVSEGLPDLNTCTLTPTGEDSTSDSCDEILRNSTIDFKLETAFPSRCFDAQPVVQTSPTTESNKSQHDSEGLPDLNTCTLTPTGEDSTSDSCDEILRNAAIDVELGVIFSNSCIETTASGESELKICTLTPTCDDSASDSCDEILRNSTIDFKLGTIFPSRCFDAQSVVQTSPTTESNKSQHDSEGLPDLNTCTLTPTGEDSTSDSCDEILRNSTIDFKSGAASLNSVEVTRGRDDYRQSLELMSSTTVRSEPSNVTKVIQPLDTFDNTLQYNPIPDTTRINQTDEDSTSDSCEEVLRNIELVVQHSEPPEVNIIPLNESTESSYLTRLQSESKVRLLKQRIHGMLL